MMSEPLKSSVFVILFSSLVSFSAGAISGLSRSDCVVEDVAYQAQFGLQSVMTDLLVAAEAEDPQDQDRIDEITKSLELIADDLRQAENDLRDCRNPVR